jgi:predicted AlkP superfamily phosphohydrolase/phosphomutase
MLRHRVLLAFVSGFGLLCCSGCSSENTAEQSLGPVVLVGIDGGSWSAIEELWAQDGLPHLRRLAESGSRSLLIPVADASPVIWTSMATGVVPERHGITNFVVKTENGDVPVSSAVRKVPAIWNMASAAQKRVSIVGWWASWPAEPVSGVIVSDRPLANIDKTVSPPEFAKFFQSILSEEGDQREPSRVETRIERQDRGVGAVARHLITSDFDLLMLYQRNVDAESHRYWKYFRPQNFEVVDEVETDRFADRIPQAYEAVDRPIGDLIEAAPSNTTFFVVSDHGFYALKRPRRRISFDLDRLLESMGYLKRVDGKIDWSRTRATAWDSPPDMRIKMVRLTRFENVPTTTESTRALDQTRAELVEELSRLTYRSGKPVFRVRLPRGNEAERGGDITAAVQSEGATPEILMGERVLLTDTRVGQEISGSHSQGTEGIFIASGPIIDPTTQVESVHSLDITPTLLVAMGLPVAQDFDGEPRLELFEKRFLHQHPPRSISTWGTSKQGKPLASDEDEALIEELKALGYLE